MKKLKIRRKYKQKHVWRYRGFSLSVFRWITISCERVIFIERRTVLKPKKYLHRIKIWATNSFEIKWISNTKNERFRKRIKYEFWKTKTTSKDKLINFEQQTKISKDKKKRNFEQKIISKDEKMNFEQPKRFQRWKNEFLAKKAVSKDKKTFFKSKKKR